jgi:hypothetical protein
MVNTGEPLGFVGTIQIFLPARLLARGKVMVLVSVVNVTLVELLGIV